MAVIDVVGILGDLIGQPSENPPGDERPVARYVSELLRSHGYTVMTVESVIGRPNVVARLVRGSGRRLILQAHADTKPALGPWTSDPFRATERNGRIYGLGACDAKGGLAAQLAAAVALAGDPEWSGELVVQAVADEEDGSRHGAEYLLELGELAADAAVVAEPTSCMPSTAQLGNAWAEVTVTGLAAHAGNPGLGTDAFEMALRYLDALRHVVATASTDARFPGHPRINIGDVHMPGHPGTVPGECRLRCDIRVLPGQDRDDVFAWYEQAAARIPGAGIEVRRYQGGGCQSHQVNEDEAIVQSFRSAQAACGQPTESMPFFGGTDARYFAMAGTPAVVFGPGSLRQAHAPDEYVPIAELARATAYLKLAAAAFLSAP
ncbi:ArgE/DapE family deacylase [Micromonospora lupini]|uniref:M20 family metallopeptidase n=1 Tax=Micromonospora lupini TaxID=285679 RepID=UPI0033C194F7